jgi:uroporphyrinogen-III synthase
MGAQVEVLALYRSVLDGEGAGALRAALEEGTIDAVTFTSASAVRGFVEAVGAEAARRAPAISIGPVTSDAARAAGLEVAAEAAAATIPALVTAVERHLRGQPPSGPAARPDEPALSVAEAR